jgi:hypothetical protein
MSTDTIMAQAEYVRLLVALRKIVLIDDHAIGDLRAREQMAEIARAALQVEA